MDIVFDFGNVLFEWNPARLVADWFPASARAEWAADRLAHTLVAHHDWQAFDVGRISSRELARRCATRLDLPVDALTAFIEQIPNVLPLIDETVVCTDALMRASTDGQRLYYLSNMPLPWADVLEARCPWITRFDDGIFSARVQLAKPDPAIYALAEVRFGLDPANTLFLDDVADNVAAARARGWHAEQITTPDSVRQALRRHGIAEPDACVRP
ncbi:MAG: HAD family phosphatase [Burkholderiales bacterium]|nr:HAD family phosphatase [Burkholderiales bacterium]